MSVAKRFIWNTLLLTVTSLLMRLLSMSFQVYLTNRIGPEGIGLFELLMSVYGFAAAFAVSGIRLSTTRLVLEMKARKTGGAMKLCLCYAGCLGLLAAVLLYSCSGVLARCWLDVPRLVSALRILAFSLPCLSVSSCLSGWFTARRQAGRTAANQLLETVFHMTVTTAALVRYQPETPAQACLLLVCCSCVSDMLSVAIGWMFYRITPDKGNVCKKSLLKKLLSIALPDAVGSWVRSGLVSAKHLLIPKGLKQCGATSAQALAAYGTVQGMVMPIIGFPAVFLGTISGLLTPEIAESCAFGQNRRLFSIMQRVLHLTLLFSFLAAGLLLVYSGELGRTLYKSDEATRYIKLLAPVVPLMYLDMTVDGMLKGMGLQNASMRINILDAGLSLLLVWQVIPRVGMAGYLLVIYVSETLNFLLSYHQLRKHAGLWLPFYRSVLAPILAALCGVSLPRLVLPFFCERQPFAAVWMNVLLYYCLLRCLGSVTKRDIQWFKSLFFK